MYHGVKSVEAIEDHQLVIRFDNDERRVFDLKPLLAIGRFRELIPPQAFRKVRVAFDAVEWENGLDLDPEYLYDQSKACKQKQLSSPDATGRETA